MSEGYSLPRRLDTDPESLQRDLMKLVLTIVELVRQLMERQAIRRGVFKSVKDLNTKIRAFINGWNDRSHPFGWTKTADDILRKANRPTTSNSRH